jgi:hypothetical protein
MWSITRKGQLDFQWSGVIKRVGGISGGQTSGLLDVQPPGPPLAHARNNPSNNNLSVWPPCHTPHQPNLIPDHWKSIIPLSPWPTVETLQIMSCGQINFIPAGGYVGNIHLQWRLLNGHVSTLVVHTYSMHIPPYGGSVNSICSVHILSEI